LRNESILLINQPSPLVLSFMAMSVKFHELRDAQSEMRRCNAGGAPGIMVSGAIWCAGGVTWLTRPTRTAFAVLFVGGMMIFRISSLISRHAFRRTGPTKANPLNRLGLEATAVLFVGLLIAYSLLATTSAASIPVLAILVGARYFLFDTIYGDRRFWALGAVIVAIGWMGLQEQAALPLNVACLVGAAELLVGMLFAWTDSRRPAH